MFQVITTWGVRNNIDFLSLSCTRHAEDVRHVRTTISENSDLVYSCYCNKWLEIFSSPHLHSCLIFYFCVISSYSSFAALSFSFSVLMLSVLVITQARQFLSNLGNLNQTQIFAKIENVEVSCILLTPFTFFYIYHLDK